MVSPYYKEHKVYISVNQKKKLKAALKAKKSTLTVKVQDASTAAAAINGDGDSKGGGGGGEIALLLLTKRQIMKLERSKRGYTTVNMSRRQVRANKTYKGGFLGLLAGLAVRALPYLLGGLVSGAASSAVKRVMSRGDGVFIQKGNHCYQAHPVEGNGLFLSPHGRRLAAVGDGLFLKHGNNVESGEGLILGKNSPFKNIPILGWIL